MPNEHLREQNKQTVLESAMECFKEYGIESTTLEKIAVRSGLTTRSVQRYYLTKSNLAKKVMDRLMDNIYNEIHSIPARQDMKDLNGREQLIKILGIRAEIAATYYKSIFCLNEFELYFTKRIKTAEFYERYKSGSSFVVNLTLRALEKGIKDGSIRKDIDKTAVLDMINLTFGGLLQKIAESRINPSLDIIVRSESQLNSFIEVIRCYLSPKSDKAAV